MVWRISYLFSVAVLLCPLCAGLFLQRLSFEAAALSVPSMAGACALTLLVGALLSRWGVRLSQVKSKGLLAHGCMLLGTAACLVDGSGLVGNVIDPRLMSMLSFGLYGVGQGSSLLAWARLFATLDMREVILHTAASCVCGGILAFFAIGLRTEWLVAFALALPVASGVAWKTAASGRAVFSAPIEGHANSGLFCWKPLSMLAMAGFSAGAESVVSAALPISFETSLVAVVGAAVLFMARPSHGFRLDYLFKASVGVYVLGFLLLLIGAPTLSAVLIGLSYWGIVFFAGALLYKDVHRNGTAVGWLFGMGFAVFEAMRLLGYLLLHAMVGTVGDGTMAAAVCFVAAVLFAICLVACWLTEHAGSWRWTAEPVAREAPSAVMDENALLATRLRANAVYRGLTPREYEVARLILEGKTVGEIAQELLVSQNTVKTHTKHIYAKLDVHKKEELRAALLSGDVYAGR